MNSNLKGISFTREISTENIGMRKFYTIITKLFNKEMAELVLTQVIFNTKIDSDLFSSLIIYSLKRSLKLCTIALNIIRIICWVTTPMYEWGFISYRALVSLGMSATNCKFKNLCGFEKMERLVRSNHHSSWLDVVQI